MMGYYLGKLYRGLEELKIELSEERIQQLIQFYELLVEKNKVMNLTAITEFDEVLTKHFLDSLSIVKVIDLNHPYRVLDLGTGAGFPGIPLKIAFPNLNIVLMDSVNKKVIFLKEVISELKLEKMEAVHGRAEDLAKLDKYRESFDLCVSRAVAKLPSLSEYCIPFLKKGGYFISYKSADMEQELLGSEKAIKILGGKLELVEAFQLPDTDISRTLVNIKKIKNTPKTFPRKAGTPVSSPLGLQ